MSHQNVHPLEQPPLPGQARLSPVRIEHVDDEALQQQAHAADVAPGQRKKMRMKPLPKPIAVPAAGFLSSTFSRSPQRQIERSSDSRSETPVQVIWAPTPKPTLSPAARTSPTPTRNSSGSKHRLSPGAEIELVAASDATQAPMLQLQLSFRNLNDSDVLSFSDPIAIVFHAVVPHHGLPVWSEVGRTECKHNSMNPNFSQKVIIAVHPTPALEESEPGSGLLRVDVFDMDDHRIQPAQFDPFKDACDYMGGLCISERSITLRMFGEAEKLSKLSLFANMSRVGRIASGTLPPLPAQSPLEFNFMLASTPTAFCILTCCLVESDQASSFQPLEALESSAQSKYPRTIEDRLEPRTAGVLHVLTDKDALIIQQVPPLPLASCCVLRV